MGPGSPDLPGSQTHSVHSPGPARGGLQPQQEDYSDQGEQYSRVVSVTTETVDGNRGVRNHRDHYSRNNKSAITMSSSGLYGDHYTIPMGTTTAEKKEGRYHGDLYSRNDKRTVTMETSTAGPTSGS